MILDATCGSKMMWFDKARDDVIYADKRHESHVLCDGRALSISPDVQIDYTLMPFSDNTFSLVVFDPPHLNSLGDTSWMIKKYGRLSGDWQKEIKKGFDECMRVLKPHGTLIFKWNETQIKVSDVINSIDYCPLFGHTSGRASKTIWMTFLKA